MAALASPCSVRKKENVRRCMEIMPYKAAVSTKMDIAISPA